MKIQYAFQSKVIKSVNPIFYLVFLIFTSILQSQTIEPKLGHLGLENGLSQSTVYAIVQDARGFLWFGTQDGLNCYDGYDVNVYKHKNSDVHSLPDNAITCLLSDPPDDLWIGTIKGGLSRYSIKEDKFYNYTADANNPGSISGSRVNTLFRDSEGSIWVGTSEGLDRYNMDNGSFTRFYSGSDSASGILTHINAICEDNDHNIWVGSGNGLFFISLDKSAKDNKFDQFETNEGKLFTEPVSAAYADDEGCVWIGLENGTLECFDKIHNKITEYKGSVKGARPIIEDKNGSILFGSLYVPGLRKLDRRSGSISVLSEVHNDLVTAVFIDNSDIVWIGTFFHAVYSYDKRNNRFKHYLANPNNPDVVMSVLQDKRGGIWFGTFGSGVKYFSKNSSKEVDLVHIPQNNNSLSSNKVLAFEEQPDGSIWIGTIGGGLDRYQPGTGKFVHYKKKSSADVNGLSSNDITALYLDHENNLWIGYYSGQIDLYDHTSGKFISRLSEKNDSIFLSDATVTIFRETGDGTLWIGTHGNGLLSYNFSTGKFKKYQVGGSRSAEPSQELAHGKGLTSPESIEGISTLCITSPETIWLGSDKSGLIKFNPSNGSSVTYSLMTDNTENTIYGILSDSSGYLWMSTNHGLLRFDTTSNHYRTYDKYDGLQANEFNQGAYFKSSRGELFFGGVNGVTSFFPSRIKDNSHIPPVYITSFKVFDKAFPLPGSVTSTKKIELSYSQNFFSFEFVALNYTLPEKNKYAYMLNGFDHDWHIVSANQRFASYTNLDPGEYQLVVKASNNDGLWNDNGTRLTILINPPFWLTWWFRILLTGTILLIAYLLYRYRIIQLLKVERIRLRIATDLHDELGSDLSAIALASQMTKGMDQSDQGRLNKIRENSLKAIDSMREIVWFIKPEHDNPEQLIEKMRDAADTLLTGKRFNFVVRNNAIRYFQDLESRQNLFLIFKETLNNIAQHSDCSEVQIELGSNTSNRLLAVSDNGRGFDPKKVKRGSGLNSLQTRAARLHATIRIVSSIGEGTKVELFPGK